MIIKYVMKEGRARLVIFNSNDLDEAFKVEEKLWSFIYGHKHFVLRKYYGQCKAADVRRPHHPCELEYAKVEIEEGFPIIIFGDSEESNLLYISILQKELNLHIEDLPIRKE